MNILFDICHPAHFHLFKNSIKELQKRNHNILITARKKDVLLDLLDNAGIEYKILAKPKASFVGLVMEVIERDIKMYFLCRKFQPDILLGTSVNITHVGRVIQRPSVVFNEDDADIVPKFAKLAYPFATYICTPDSLRDKFTKKYITYEGYHELAYLHPDRFTPKEEIVRKYDLNPYNYIVVRHSALKAHHDRGIKGLKGEIWKKALDRIKEYTLVRSVEDEKTHQIAPWDMHHVMAFARLVISDSQTMTAEAAVLGVPAIRCNSFVGKISYLEELERKYGLTYGFLPDDVEGLLKKMDEVLSKKDLREEWQRRRERMLKEKVDLTSWILGFIERYEASSSIG